MSQSTKLNLEYPGVLSHLSGHLVKGRTEARAFLGWFLEQYYRVEADEAHDAICDGIDDRGIDAIYVDDNLERIDVLQSKLLQNRKKTIGDTTLKEFYGSYSQFADPASIEQIGKTSANQDLRNIIQATDLVAKVRAGYEVRGVFVTNAQKDNSAAEFLALTPNLFMWDAQELINSYIPTGPSAPVMKPVTFDVVGHDVLEYNAGGVQALVAPLKATELVQLDGLASQELFIWNVRQSLGKTKVNKAIGTSISDPSEHKNFLLYHNGLTILSETVVRVGDRITVEGYAVVNGCQSLTSLYENRKEVTDELRVLTRLIQLSPESDLASKITHHTNNQNAINARDLQSNSSIQRRLQNEFRAEFGQDPFYTIKRGERTEAEVVIENEEAARILLAFDMQQPWSCHQSYRLFDELHSDIFARQEVNAYRILALYDMYGVVVDSLDRIDYRLMASYRLTRYFLLYLLRQALAADETGRRFVRNPREFVNADGGIERLRYAAGRVLDDIIVDLNAEVRDRDQEGKPVDFKRELKSPNPVRQLERNIIPHYQKAVNRGRAAAFGKEWSEWKPVQPVSTLHGDS